MCHPQQDTAGQWYNSRSLQLCLSAEVLKSVIAFDAQRTDCSGESRLALHIFGSSQAGKHKPYYYITIVIIMAFLAEYWIGTLVPAP